MYYLFGGQSWASNPARLLDSGSVNDYDLWWDDGESFDPPLAAAVTAKLQPFNSDHPSMSQELPEMYKAPLPILRDDLLAALKAGGVDNLDSYPVEITDPDTGQVHENYKAVNIIGLVAAADMDKSDRIAHDGIPLVDVSFDKLVLDEDKTHDMLMFRLAENNGVILVHEFVRDHLLKAGFSKLEFYNLDEVAL